MTTQYDIQRQDTTPYNVTQHGRATLTQMRQTTLPVQDSHW